MSNCPTCQHPLPGSLILGLVYCERCPPHQFMTTDGGTIPLPTPWPDIYLNDLNPQQRAKLEHEVHRRAVEGETLQVPLEGLVEAWGLNDPVPTS